MPKEIRRTLRIREGDPLEIFTDRDGEIILKKYSPIGELGSYAQEFVHSLNKTFSVHAAICDKDVFIACSSAIKRELNEKPVSGDIEEAIINRTPVQYSAEYGDMIRILDNDGKESFAGVSIAPIIALGDPIGAVVLLNRENAPLSMEAVKSAEMVALFLGKLMEQS